MYIYLFLLFLYIFKLYISPPPSLTIFFFLIYQETITRFIERLSCEYAAYIDIVQPVQVALYEMKLGLALLLSSALHKRFLDRVGQHDMDKVLVMYTACCCFCFVITAAFAAVVVVIIMLFASSLFYCS